MIKFFRKIRQNLLMENKTGKYLKYAIGEIILVVIGILIALQINNWNEHRKQRASIEQSLLEVRNNMVNDTLKMSEVIKKLQEEVTIQKEVIDAIKNEIILDSTYNEKLGKCSLINGMPITQTGFNNLKELGLGNIKNQYLEAELINYYETLKKDFEIQQGYDQSSFREYWIPYLKDNFKDYSYRNYAIPKNYKALSRDSEFLVLLKVNMETREGTLRSSNNLQTSSKNLISLIDEELKLGK